MKKLSILSLVLAASTAFAASPADTLVIQSSSDVPTMDPGVTYDTASSSLVDNMYETLLTYKGASLTQLEPRLATGWKITNGGKTVTFDLRKGVKFHSGATMTAALFTLGRIKGVDRPAILTHLPAQGGFTTLLDAGANTDVRPAYLVQWARLASVYLRVLEGRENPSVGLLSIGEEDHKGTQLVVETNTLLRELHGKGVNFFGNVEGRDVFKGTTDVVLTDGFTGNVVLKLAEGEAKVIFSWVKEALNSNLKSKVGGLLARDALRGLAERMDPSTYGASILIGVRGLAFIGHGSADAKAVKNALLRAARAHEGNLIPRLEAAFKEQAG